MDCVFPHLPAMHQLETKIVRTGGICAFGHGGGVEVLPPPSPAAPPEHGLAHEVEGGALEAGFRQVRRQRTQPGHAQPRSRQSRRIRTRWAQTCTSNRHRGWLAASTPPPRRRPPSTSRRTACAAIKSPSRQAACSG